MKKLLTFSIIFLFILMSIVPSSGNKVEYVHNYPFNPDAVDSSKRLLACDHLVYFGGEPVGPWNCWLFKAKLNDIGNSTCICSFGVTHNFMSGSTCINDEIIIVCSYSNGALYEIDPNDCEKNKIGGGGVGLNGLTYDTTNDLLYGCSSSALYKIDPETGNQELVGPFNTGTAMIDIACDANGSLYGWDVKFSGESYLYEIDTQTGEATIIGGMGMTLCHAQSGGFCIIDDILYLAANIISPIYGSYLVECDEDTGECNILGQIENNYEVGIFVIPWNFRPNTPSNPIPSHGAIGVPIDTDLSWIGGDPDNDEVKYDIYFGNTSPPPKIISNQSNTNFDPGILEYCTTYYWQIVAWDKYDAYIKGPVWNFTIKTKAKDIYGLEREKLEVMMPRNKQTTINWWSQQLFNRFSFFQKILGVLG